MGCWFSCGSHKDIDIIDDLSVSSELSNNEESLDLSNIVTDPSRIERLKLKHVWLWTDLPKNIDGYDAVTNMVTWKSVLVKTITDRGRMNKTLKSLNALSNNQVKYLVSPKVLYVDDAEMKISYNISYGSLNSLIRNISYIPEIHIKHLAAQIACGIFEMHRIGLDAKYIMTNNCLFDKCGFLKLANVEICAVKDYADVAHNKFIHPLSIGQKFPSKSSVWYSFAIILMDLYHVEKLYDNQLHLSLPVNISRSAKNLITNLLSATAESVITDSFIKNHPFFEIIDWKVFKSQNMKLPYTLKRGVASTMNYNLFDILSCGFEYGLKCRKWNER